MEILLRDVPRLATLTGVIFSAFVAVVMCGCAATEKEVTPSEWLDQNSSVLRDLESFEKPKQQSAIARLRGLGRTRGCAVAAAVLRESKIDYRAEILLARLLADWGDPEALPHLLKFLRHQDRGAVELAQEGLIASRDDPFVRRSLFELLESPDAAARLAAAEVLFAFEDGEVYELCARAYTAERDRVVRGVYVAKFLRGSDPRRTDFLIEALSDHDAAIREMVWGALRKDRVLPRVDYDPNAEPAARARAAARLKSSRRSVRR